LRAASSIRIDGNVVMTLRPLLDNTLAMFMAMVPPSALAENQGSIRHRVNDVRRDRYLDCERGQLGEQSADHVHDVRGKPDERAEHEGENKDPYSGRDDRTIQSAELLVREGAQYLDTMEFLIQVTLSGFAFDRLTRA
jgi:hypothetical protein